MNDGQMLVWTLIVVYLLAHLVYWIAGSAASTWKIVQGEEKSVPPVSISSMSLSELQGLIPFASEGFVEVIQAEIRSRKAKESLPKVQVAGAHDDLNRYDVLGPDFGD